MWRNTGDIDKSHDPKQQWNSTNFTVQLNNNTGKVKSLSTEIKFKAGLGRRIISGFNLLIDADTGQVTITIQAGSENILGNTFQSLRDNYKNNLKIQDKGIGKELCITVPHAEIKEVLTQANQCEDKFYQLKPPTIEAIVDSVSIDNIKIFAGKNKWVLDKLENYAKPKW